MTQRRRPRHLETRINRLMPPPPDWRWLSLPTWTALSLGIVAGWWLAIAGGAAPTGAVTYVFLGALFFFSFCLSRVVNWQMRKFMIRRRARKIVEEGRDLEQRPERKATR